MKRNPNGYGMVSKLSGERARPYAVYSNSYKLNGKRHHDVIGYYATEIEARNALAEWNRNRSTKTSYLLIDLYNEWSKIHFESVSSSAVYVYSAAWKKLVSLYNTPVRDIKTGHFQQIVDAMVRDGYSYQSISNVKTLAGLLEKYAMQNDIIQKNYAEFIVLKRQKSAEKEPFTESQIYLISEAAKQGIGVSREILCLIFSGFRIREFLSLTKSSCNYDFLVGGMKTENSINRTVPVHPAVADYINEMMNHDNYLVEIDGKHPSYSCFKKNFDETLEYLGIRNQSGCRFTPHSTRHTFATLCYRYGVDSLATKKMLGHSPNGGVTETVYIHIDNEILKSEINKIPSTICQQLKPNQSR